VAESTKAANVRIPAELLPLAF